MSADEIAFAGLERQAEMIHAGDLTPSELVAHQLERIEALDERLNAFRVVMAERAIAEAKAVEQRIAGRIRLPLGGVPVAISDTEDVAGEVTTWGTVAFDQPAAADSEAVRRLRSAGAIVIGKTNVPELAAWGFTESECWGTTRNPWDPQRTPGGASGGAAAAVAAGLVAAASGVDGSGSIRVPAAYCGLFGLKPQRGRVPLAPLDEHWGGLTVAGALTRSVADTALWLDVVAGSAPGGPAGPAQREHPFADYAEARPHRLRIAYSLRPPRSGAPPIVADSVAAAVEETARLLRDLGHAVEHRDPAWGRVAADFSTRFLRGIADHAASAPHPGRLEPRTRGLVNLGRRIPSPALSRARRSEAADARRILGGLFSQCDVLITPVSGVPPFTVDRWRDLGAVSTALRMSRVLPFTPPWNHLGNPAASIPAGFTDDGMPLAVQLVVRPGDEPTLLSLAAEIEAERPWAERVPSVS